jgi:HD-like signal output (HDOD) protein
MSATSVMTIDNILESVGRLPSPPGAIMNIIRTLDDGDATAEMLAKQIEADIGLLTSELLSFVCVRSLTSQ